MAEISEAVNSTFKLRGKPHTFAVAVLLSTFLCYTYQVRYRHFLDHKFTLKGDFFMNKQQLATKIWEAANKMRSKIEANEYKDYILGFIF